MKVNLINLQKRIPLTSSISRKIKNTVLHVFDSEQRQKAGEITVCLLNNRKIRGLNKKYLGENRTTDVIAFNSSIKGREISADIAVSADTAFSNSKIFNTTPLYELLLYVAHGTLHILGYDDKTAAQRKIMESKAVDILKRLPGEPKGCGCQVVSIHLS